MLLRRQPCPPLLCLPPQLESHSKLRKLVCSFFRNLYLFEIELSQSDHFSHRHLTVTTKTKGDETAEV